MRRLTVSFSSIILTYQHFQSSIWMITWRLTEPCRRHYPRRSPSRSLGYDGQSGESQRSRKLSLSSESLLATCTNSTYTLESRTYQEKCFRLRFSRLSTIPSCFRYRPILRTRWIAPWLCMPKLRASIQSSNMGLRVQPPGSLIANWSFEQAPQSLPRSFIQTDIYYLCGSSGIILILDLTPTDTLRSSSRSVTS